MEHIGENLRCCLACHHEGIFDIFIEPKRSCLEQGSLGQRHIDVISTEEEEKKVCLAELTNRDKLLPWNGNNAHVAHVAQSDPLLDLTRQKQDILDVVEQVVEKVLEDLRCDKLWGPLSDLRHEETVHDNGRTIVLVTSMDVEAA